MVEELCFRALLLRCVPMPWRALPRYVFLSSVLFGLFHWWQGPSNVVTSAAFGSVMALVYYTTRTIWPVAIAHASVDALWFASLP